MGNISVHVNAGDKPVEKNEVFYPGVSDEYYNKWRQCLKLKKDEMDTLPVKDKQHLMQLPLEDIVNHVYDQCIKEETEWATVYLQDRKKTTEFKNYLNNMNSSPVAESKM